MAVRKCSGTVSAKSAMSAGIRAEMKAAGRYQARQKVQTTIVCKQCHVPAWHTDIDVNGICKFCRGE